MTLEKTWENRIEKLFENLEEFKKNDNYSLMKTLFYIGVLDSIDLLVRLPMNNGEKKAKQIIVDLQHEAVEFITESLDEINKGEQ